MPKINVQQELEQHAIRATLPKPIPAVKKGSSFVKPEIPKDIRVLETPKEKSPITNQSVQILEREYQHIRMERSKLSTQISRMIDAKCTKEELAQHYQRIEDYRPILKDLYEKIEHVKKHGTLPEIKVEVVRADQQSIYELRDIKDKLIDRRCKLKKKIAVAIAKNPNRITNWHIELEQANAEYDAIDLQIKNYGK